MKSLLGLTFLIEEMLSNSCRPAGPRDIDFRHQKLPASLFQRLQVCVVSGLDSDHYLFLTFKMQENQVFLYDQPAATSACCWRSIRHWCPGQPLAIVVPQHKRYLQEHRVVGLPVRVLRY